MSDTPRVTPQPPAEPTPGKRPAISPLDIIMFLCELFGVASLALWGFTAWPLPWSIVAGIGAPVLAILVWALFVSPRAVLAVHPFIRAVVQLLVFASVTIAWWSMGNAWVGLAYGVIAVTVGVLTGRRRFT